jgi:hypothetical protein
MPPMQMGHVPGGAKIGNVRAWILATKASASSLFVMRSMVPSALGGTSPEGAVIDDTSISQVVSMVEDGD